jgi:cytochrome c-type biogenesis protein CcmH/NrfF
MDAKFQQELINTLLGFIPPLLVGLVFWLIMRSILRADKTERKVWNEIENEERIKAGLPPKQDSSESK